MTEAIKTAEAIKLTEAELALIQRYQAETMQLQNLMQVKNQALGDLVKVALLSRGLAPEEYGIEPDGTIKALPKPEPKAEAGK